MHVCENLSPGQNSMQSGKAKTHLWVLEYDREVPRTIDPIMGYTSSSDMKQQLRLTFETRDEAVSYAKRNASTTTSSNRMNRRENVSPTPTTSATTAASLGHTEGAVFGHAVHNRPRSSTG